MMPEHVHLLVTEPERTILATALKALKQSVARRLIAGREHFWQPRYYDFNVWSSAKRTEKLKYIHRNPVARGARRETGRLAVEQLSSLCLWRRRSD